MNEKVFCSFCKFWHRATMWTDFPVDYCYPPGAEQDTYLRPHEPIRLICGVQNSMNICKYFKSKKEK